MKKKFNCSCAFHSVSMNDDEQNNQSDFGVLQCYTLTQKPNYQLRQNALKCI